MTPHQRTSRIFEMVAFQDGLQRSSVKQMFPDADDREVFLRVAARRLDRQTMIAAYGWDPDAHQ